MTNSKVAIIGKGPTWRLCPDDIETWGVISVIKYRKTDLLFDIHDIENKWYDDNCPEAKLESLEWRKQALDNNIKLLVNVDYPYEAICKEFDTDYFTNSISFMIAYAIYIGKKEIDLYGVSMGHNTEYEYQRPNVDFWCGVAKGRGVKIRVPFGYTTIMTSPDNMVYGYFIPRRMQ